MDGASEPRYKAAMKRSFPALVLVVCASLLFAACKKSEDPAPVPVTTASAAPTPVGDAPAATPTATVAAVVAPPVVAAPTPGVPIDGCCSALAAVSKSGRGADAKSKSATAAKICSGIAPLVKAGKTTRTAALATIKAQMSGVDLPSECH